VTRFEVGSVRRFSGALRVGVRGGGGGSVSIAAVSSGSGMGSGRISGGVAASTDLLLDPPRESLCLFLEDSSSKGFGRVEQGSEETARSRDNSAGSWSIWPRTARDFSRVS
jgi:hypothetical protein